MTQTPLWITVALSLFAGLGVGSFVSQIVATRSASGIARANRLHEQRRQAHAELISAIYEVMWREDGMPFASISTMREWLEAHRRLARLQVQVQLLSERDTSAAAAKAVDDVIDFAHPSRGDSPLVQHADRLKEAGESVNTYLGAAAAELQSRR